MRPTYESIVLTKTTAAKLTDFSTQDISSVRLHNDFVLVSDKMGQTRSVAKNKFVREFIKNRKLASDNLIAIRTNHPHVFEVASASGRGHYEVTATRYNMVCRCEDYKNQLWVFNGDGACKHSYRILADIGFNSLKEYREAWEKPGMTLEKIVMQKAEQLQSV